MIGQSFRDMIEAECAAHGIKPEFAIGGKHPFAHWTDPDGTERKFVFPSTPGDHRSFLNNRAQIRKILAGGAQEDEDREPSALVTLRDGLPSCTSRDIADAFSKQHKDVLRAIDRICEDCGPEFTERNFAPSTYVDPTGRSIRSFDLTRDGFAMVAMGFTGAAATKWKIKFLSAFNEMERQLTIPPAAQQAEIERLKSDLSALTDLVFELSSRSLPAPAEVVTVIKYKRPWVSRRKRMAAA